MTTAIMKWTKTGDHQYKSGEWKIIGIGNKNNTTRQLRIVYWPSYRGSIKTKLPNGVSFKGGTIAQAKQFCRAYQALLDLQP